MNEIRFTRESPVEDTTTTIKVHPCRWGEGGLRSVDLWIEQSTYKRLERRTSPRRSMLFTLPPEDRLRLIALLSEGLS